VIFRALDFSLYDAFFYLDDLSSKMVALGKDNKFYYGLPPDAVYDLPATA
jgi:hypothetical protein